MVNMKDLGVKDYTLNLMVATGTFIRYLSVSLPTYVVILYLLSTYLPTYVFICKILVSHCNRFGSKYWCCYNILQLELEQCELNTLDTHKSSSDSLLLEANYQ